MIHKTIFDKGFRMSEGDFEYNYHKSLTDKLDNSKKSFDQNSINEIVLWKVSRYVDIKSNVLKLINSIDIESTKIDKEKTAKILEELLLTKGIQLPMASTILRFKNKQIYQIIDQRVFRIIYKGEKLKLKTYPSTKNIQLQIELYFSYLQDLKVVCKKLNIPFSDSDRILFMADKRINKDLPLDNY